MTNTNQEKEKILRDYVYLDKPEEIYEYPLGTYFKYFTPNPENKNEMILKQGGTLYHRHPEGKCIQFMLPFGKIYSIANWKKNKYLVATSQKTENGYFYDPNMRHDLAKINTEAHLQKCHNPITIPNENAEKELDVVLEDDNDVDPEYEIDDSSDSSSHKKKSTRRIKRLNKRKKSIVKTRRRPKSNTKTRRQKKHE